MSLDQNRAMNPRDIIAPDITSGEIYLANKAIYISDKCCPKCGKHVVKTGVHIQSRIKYRCGYKSWYSDKLSFCSECDTYYISPKLLSKLNSKIESKLRIHHYVHPANVWQMYNRSTGETIYTVEYTPCGTGNAFQALEDMYYDMSDEERSYIDDRTLYIHKGRIYCQHHHHEIAQATAYLQNVYGNEIRLNVSYCKRCHKYFIDHHSYKMYLRDYKAILGDIALIGNSKSNSSEWNLAEESLLHLFGYNVSRSSKLTATERQRIIAMVIDHDVMSKGEVINFLCSMLTMHESRRNYADSVEKWEEDLDFTNSYDMDNQMTGELQDAEPYFRNRYVINSRIQRPLPQRKGGVYTGKRVMHTDSQYGAGTVIAEYKDFFTVEFDNGKQQNFGREVFRNGQVHILTES